MHRLLTPSLNIYEMQPAATHGAHLQAKRRMVSVDSQDRQGVRMVAQQEQTGATSRRTEASSMSALIALAMIGALVLASPG